jgi:arginyl-tRNA synthetase
MLTKMKKKLSEHLAPLLGLTAADICTALESPSDSTRGDLAFPCFQLAKSRKQAPAQIATQEAVKLQKNIPEGFDKVEVAGGYLNFFFKQSQWAEAVVAEILSRGDAVGDDLSVGNNSTIAIDYSSPNLAKPMSIGHLRSSVIGQSLINIFKSLGYKTIGINYLGDWGVQFGKLAWAHLNLEELRSRAQRLKSQIIAKGFDELVWDKLIGDTANGDHSSFDYLYALYVVFHAASGFDKELDQFGRDYFLRLENRNRPEFKNDPLAASIEKIWQEFLNVSIIEGDRVYKLLGIKHDLVRGESFHEPDLAKVVTELKAKNLLKESQGAQIVDLEPFGLTPCLIQKSDGATLYATRDIAAAIYRHDTLKAEKLIYVVGAEQTLHFKQFFKVLDLMGYSWAKGCVHVPFGLYRFKEGKMSTRRGNVVFLEDVLFRAIDLVKQVIQEKNPELKNAEEVAKQVGTAAVIFNDLMNDRQKNIDFDWDRLLDFNGDTGPYVQYSHVRCCSILNKWGKPIPTATSASHLKEKLELNLIRILSRFDDIVRLSGEQLKPNWIAHYLLELSKAFNSFYYEHRILEGDISIQEARITLVAATKYVLKKGLYLLGIKAPEAM